MLITQRGACRVWVHKLGFSLDRGEKAREIDARSSEGRLELGTMHDDFEFRECGTTHHWNEAAL